MSARGTDLNPPLYHLAAKASGLLVGNEALAVRLPSLLGFTAATLALFVFLRRRVGDEFALVGAMVPTVSGLYMYAYEGRPYGLVLGFSAVAVAAWQRRGETGSHMAAPVICSGALMAGTKVLLLDEPTEGVAPLVQARLGRLLREINTSGLLIFIAESNSKYLSGIADEVYVIERGRVSPPQRPGGHDDSQDHREQGHA